jgi:hypothetical protein
MPSLFRPCSGRAQEGRGAGFSSASASALRGSGGGTAPAGAPCCETDDEFARSLQRQFDEEADEKVKRASSKCPLCLETVPFDKSIQLDCSHRICCDCFHSYLNIKITEKRVAEEELVCPMPDCNVTITVPQVEGSTRGTPLWDRFLASRVELWRPDAREGEILCICPTPSCEGRFLASAFLPEVQCPKCKRPFCPKCQQRHPGVPCERYAAWRRSENPGAGDRELEELIRKEKWQRCPCCQAPAERQIGCNFMTCYSEQCRGKKHFCYLCGVELTELQHFTHFPEGIFENACENCDRRNEEGLAKVKLFEPWDPWWVVMFQDFRNWLQGLQVAPGGAAGGA